MIQDSTWEEAGTEGVLVAVVVFAVDDEAGEQSRRKLLGLRRPRLRQETLALLVCLGWIELTL